MKKLGELLYIQMLWTLMFLIACVTDENFRHPAMWPVYFWGGVLFLVSLRGQFVLRKLKAQGAGPNCDHSAELVAVYASAAKAMRKAKEKS